MLQYLPQNELTQVRHSRLPRLKLAYDFLGPLLAVVDAFIIATTTIMGSVIYWRFILNEPGDVSVFLGLGLATGMTYASIGWQFGLYRILSLIRPRRDYGQIVAGWLFVMLLTALALFLFKVGDQFSRGSIILSAGIALIALITWRTIIKRYLLTALANGTIEGRRALLIGTQNELADFNGDELLLGFGLNEVGRFVLPKHRARNSATSSLECGILKKAIEQSRAMSAEEIILALPWSNATHLNVVREGLRISPLPVRLLPDKYIRSIWDSDTAYAERRMLIDLQRAPLTRTEQFIKRTFDVVISSLLLLVCAPVLVLVSIVIKLDSPGSVIFRQHRKGFNGQEFLIYKFRTMTVMEDGSNIKQATKNDLRVTRFGRFLRRSSIDELLQLFNVMKGDMSLVGPRPLPVSMDDKYEMLVANYAFRHHMKSGITGWAQVNGFRGETKQLAQMKKRVELDVWYINNWRVVLDVQILLRTLVEQMRSQKAY
jgi:Undecaprenyl-phosphate glucose phosphotransferase